MTEPETGFQREHHDGMCNAPRPHNWREACRRTARHSGPHYSALASRPPYSPGHGPVFWTAERDYLDVGDILGMLDREQEARALEAERVGALQEAYADTIRQAHAFMHYGTLEDCGAGICVERRTLLEGRRAAGPDLDDRLREAAKRVLSAMPSSDEQREALYALEHAVYAPPAVSRPEPRLDVERVAALLDKIAEYRDRAIEQDHGVTEQTLAELLMYGRALAAPPDVSRPEPRLDVERLARALPDTLMYSGSDRRRGVAERIATEYAALGPSEREQEGLR